MDVNAAMSGDAQVKIGVTSGLDLKMEPENAFAKVEVDNTVAKIEEPCDKLVVVNESANKLHKKTENESTQEIIVIDVDALELDLNHGRIGKIENLEPLQCIER